MHQPSDGSPLPTPENTPHSVRSGNQPAIEAVNSSVRGLVDMSGSREVISTPRDEEKQLIAQLRASGTAEATRVLRWYDMPDLTRTPGHPVNLIVDKIMNVEEMRGFDVIETPEIVGTYETFDLFNFPKDHPARRPSDTYFAAPEKIFRTHTTVMWHYYFNAKGIREKLERQGEVGAISYGKVYRRDEVDSRHYPVFHQIDGLYVCEKEKHVIGKEDLVRVLHGIARAIYGNDVESKVLDETYPYTDPSVEMDIKFGDKFLEILGAGVVHPQVLENLGIDSNRYNGWALGPGVERMVMTKMKVPDIRLLWSTDSRVTKQWGNLDKTFENVSRLPSTYRDISFLINKTTHPNEFFDIIRDEGGGLVEEVTQLDRYENDKKFGADKVSLTYRIVYRSHERTLTNEEINGVQTRIREKTRDSLGVTLR